VSGPVSHVQMILNPVAGSGRGRKELEHILRLFRSYNISVDLHVTEYHEHAVELVDQADLEDADALVIAGGDGTVYHAINGLMRRPDRKAVQIGIVPIGTGNAGAWDTTGVRSIEEAVRVIADGRSRSVDVGTFLMDHQTYYFLNVIGAGFVAEVGKVAGKFKWMGEFAYSAGVFWELVNLRPHHMHFEVDGDQFDLEGTFVEFCNTRYTAADMLMAPGAEIDDGYLDMVICKDITRRLLVKSFPKIFKGTHVEMEEIDVLKVQSVKLWTEEPKVLIPDGEIFGRTPIEVGIEPGAVKVFYRVEAA